MNRKINDNLLKKVDDISDKDIESLQKTIISMDLENETQKRHI